MDPDTKYLVGYVLGDGMIKWYRHSGYEVKLTEENREYAEYLAELVAKVLGATPSISRDRRRKAWRVRVYRRRAYERMKTTIDMALKEPDAHLIGGLFDAEGDYTVSKNRLRFTNKDPRLVGLITDYLKKLGIKHHVYERKRKESTWYTVEIYGQNVLKLLPYLDLRHPKWFRTLTLMLRPRLCL